jgi:hypothetical protein
MMATFFSSSSSRGKMNDPGSFSNPRSRKKLLETKRAYTVACGILSSGQGFKERHSRHPPSAIRAPEQATGQKVQAVQPRILVSRP